MFPRSKRLAVAALLGAAVLPLGHAAPASAASYCRAIAAQTSAGFTQTVVVTGAYTAAGASDVHLTCGIVRNGQTIARFTDKLSGPAAVVQGTVEISVGSYTTCYDVVVSYVSGGFTSTTTCP